MEMQKLALELPLLISSRESNKPTVQENSFQDVLAGYLNQVNEVNLQGEKMSRALALGKNVELHQVMLATEQANLALQLTVQIRNKVVEAYQEVMRMQV